MAKAGDKDALAKLTSELKLCKAPSATYHDIKSVVSLHIIRQRTSDDVEESIAEKIREDLPAATLYSFIVLKGTTVVF